MRVLPEGWVESHCGGAPLLAADITGEPRNALYELALGLKDKTS